MPARAATPNEVKRASRAAPRAGTTAVGMVTGSSWDSGATSTPSAPASMLASVVLAIEIMFGDRPLSRAADSFSADARVAIPNLVQR